LFDGVEEALSNVGSAFPFLLLLFLGGFPIKWGIPYTNTRNRTQSHYIIFSGACQEFLNESSKYALFCEQNSTLS